MHEQLLILFICRLAAAEGSATMNETVVVECRRTGSLTDMGSKYVTANAFD